MEILETPPHVKHGENFQKQCGSYANMLQQRNGKKSSMTMIKQNEMKREMEIKRTRAKIITLKNY